MSGTNTNPAFSDFELEKIGLKFKTGSAYQVVECIGSLEEEMESKTVTKKCRGVIKKKKTKGTGNGTLKISLHIPWNIYTQAFGMNLDTLIEGVKAYGRNSVHEEFAIVGDVKDEDGVAKLLAYPNAVIESGTAKKIENGAEEVAEVELEVSVMPDEYGNGKYEALVDDIDDEVASAWMASFTPALVQKAS